MGELKTARLLRGFRGRKPCGVAALVETILAFARMGAQLSPHLIEAEINPLFVMPTGEGIRAGDGLVVLG